MIKKMMAAPVMQAAQTPRASGDASFASQCLGEFLSRIQRIDPHPAVLDLGVLCGANIAFLGAKGCRVSVESLPAALPETAAPAKAPEKQNPIPISPLGYPPESFSGVLAWDAISRMGVADAGHFVATVWRLLMDGGVVLAYFPGGPGQSGVSAGRYRILAEDRLIVEAAPRHSLPLKTTPFQNRDIYTLFSRFDVVRLSQLKSGTREVLVAKTRRPVRA